MQFSMHEEKRNARRMEDVSSLFGKMNSHRNLNRRDPKREEIQTRIELRPDFLSC
jgi:hypothetical protein